MIVYFIRRTFSTKQQNQQTAIHSRLFSLLEPIGQLHVEHDSPLYIAHSWSFLIILFLLHH